MSTRGAFGFRIDGVDKITYNHADSYPDYLGEEVVKWVATACAPQRIAQTMTDVSGIALVPDGQAIATPEHRQRVGTRFADMGVGGGDGIGPGDVTYYRLLRNAQPTEGIQNIIDAGIMIDGHEFLQDSLFCEYAYIVNLDDMTVEFYEGFQEKAHNAGRYASLPVDQNHAGRYWPVALKGAYPLADIKDWRKKWAQECFRHEE